MKVLVAIDDSNSTKDILHFVLKQNWLEKAEFVILHVVKPLLVASYMSVLPSPILTDLVNEARARGRDLVKTFAHELSEKHAALSIKEMLREGFIVDEIIAFSKEWQPDLIVIGSHSKPSLEKQILGSVSLKVSCTAPCPVLIVRYLEKDKERAAETSGGHAVEERPVKD